MASNLLQFYEEIVNQELPDISGETMKESMSTMWENYQREGLKVPDSLDFNRRELRCAYLLLYSTCHSHMVIDALDKLSEEHCTQLKKQINSASSTHGFFNITSLGGGPGPDLLGILYFLKEKNLVSRNTSIKVSVVDKYKDWDSMFQKVIKKINNLSVRTHFTTQDLFEPLSAEAVESIKNTHFLCVVKFVSAIIGDKEAKKCLKRIFFLLQPGTMVLIIDNSGGPSFRDVIYLAERMGFQHILEPNRHYQFIVGNEQEPELYREQYGINPKYRSWISMAILKKKNHVSATKSVNDCSVVEQNIAEDVSNLPKGTCTTQNDGPITGVLNSNVPPGTLPEQDSTSERSPQPGCYKKMMPDDHSEVTQDALETSGNE